ncbi:Nuclear pore complex protein NUP107 [Camellia lanceoleosa]|uniref:Nuclear pore complex protein NUP107 n=1 Tax=Camellia lanceoleosa TaxID=1840588 RepID=A0ACC0IT67_9ERIC|nr:Nuclear pore complex protein NUP107 [Camellia lanceoleosa]
MDQFKTYEVAIDRSHGQGDGVSPSTVGPENRPLQVLNQQPSDSVHEAITQECKEQQRQIEMNLMVGDILHLLDVIWSWISPSEDEEKYLPFPPGDDSKGDLKKLRGSVKISEIKLGKYDKSSMLPSNIGCEVFKRLWLYNGSALHLPPLLMMLKLLVPNFSFEHCYTATYCSGSLLLFPCGGCPQCP